MPFATPLRSPGWIAVATWLALGSTACSLLSLDNLEQGGGVTSSGTASGPGSVGSSGASSPSSASSASGAGAGTSSATSSGGNGGDGGDGSGASGAGGEPGPGNGGAGPGAGGAGGTGGEGPLIIETPCVKSPLLDDFNRPDGPLGSRWIDIEGISIHEDRAENDPTTPGYLRATWDEDFGPDQEAHVILDDIDPAGAEQLLLMKIVGESNIEVLYSPTRGTVEVFTCTPSCLQWADEEVVFAEGMRLSARATADGIVRVCLDDEVVATADVSDWPGFDEGGAIGIGTLHDNERDLAFAFDDFGGGDVDDSSQ